MNTVLVATERDLEQNVLAQALDGRGYQIIRSRDGLDALDAARSKSPQVILVNVALPKLDGFALYRRFQQDEQLRRIPIVLFSTRSNDQKSERFAAELGAARFVGNALKPGALNGVIEAALAAEPISPLPKVQLAKTQSLAGSQPARPQLEVVVNNPAPAPAPASVTATVKAPVEVSGNGQSSVTPAIDRTLKLPALIALPDTEELEKLQAEQAQLQKTLQATQQLLLATQQHLQVSQQQLQDTQQQVHAARGWRDLFDTSPAAMWLVNRATQKIMAVNAAALKLFVYSYDEFMGLDSPAMLRDQTQVTTTTHVFGFRSKDGRNLSLLVNSCEVVIDAQTAELWVAHDVGYRVRGERAMADEVQRVKSLLAALPLAYCVIDAEGNLRDLNTACSALFEQGRDHLLEQSLERTLADPQQLNALKVLAAGQSMVTAVRQAGGGQRAIQFTAGQHAFGAGLRLFVLQIEREPVTVHTPSVPLAPSKLPLVLEVLRYAEDADEATLLQYAMAQLANAFDSPLAVLASLERITQTMDVVAVNHAQANRRQATGSVPVPSQWRALSAPRATTLAEQPIDALQVEGLPAIANYAVCPVSNGHELWMLAIANRDAPYTAQEQRELHDCAEILVAALVRKRQQTRLMAQVQRGAAGTESMLGLLEKLMDAHDPYAAGSSQRVAFIATAIGKQLGLTETQRLGLGLAARLHDVGNLSLPKSLLMQPTALSDVERTLMQGHVAYGVRLLNSVDLGADVAGIVEQHHERVDGSGYPAKLSGDQIRIESRILAVADVVDALSSARPHRPALTMQEALTEVRRGVGSLFDADVVTACEYLLGTGKG
jgi:HD-GYP domain-containing protein (c-di-GMP phosphodiesterase class II)/PAS domain-containing protein